MKKLFIYKTVNLITGYEYVGKHTQDNPNYLGSGLILNRAIKKYGKNNFRRDIIEICDTIEELDLREIYWIKFFNTQYPNGYNIAPGGFGGDNLTHNPNRERIIQKISKSLKIKFENMSPDEIKKRMSYPGILNPNYNRKWSETQKKNASERVSNWMKIPENIIKIKKSKKDSSKMGKYDRNGEKNPFYNKHHTNSTKKILSEYASNRWKTQLPGNSRKINIDGITYETLKKACEIKNISAPTMIKRLKSSSEKWKNWNYLLD